MTLRLKEYKLFNDIDKLFYFLHSYYFECNNIKDELGISIMKIISFL